VASQLVDFRISFLLLKRRRRELNSADLQAVDYLMEAVARIGGPPIFLARAHYLLGVLFLQGRGCDYRDHNQRDLAFQNAVEHLQASSDRKFGPAM